VPTSLFPNIPINDIFEIEFRLGYYFKCSPEFNEMDFHQFNWQYERLSKELKDNGDTGDTNLLDNMEQLKHMQG